MEDRLCWFQQDGITVHTTPPTVDFLRKFFDARIISKNLWSPCSSDLCDFFMRGYVKDQVFACNYTSIEELKVKITEVSHSINVQML